MIIKRPKLQLKRNQTATTQKRNSLIRKNDLIISGGMVNLEQLISIPSMLLFKIDIPSP